MDAVVLADERSHFSLYLHTNRGCAGACRCENVVDENRFR